MSIYETLSLRIAFAAVRYNFYATSVVANTKPELSTLNFYGLDGS